MRFGHPIIRLCLQPATIFEPDSLDPLSWLHRYRPRRLKRPHRGRVFRLPTRQQAMVDARHILQRLRREGVGLDPDQQTAYVLASLRLICPFIFETLLLHCFADLGIRVRHGRFTGDAGIDGILETEEGRVLVQAKRYRNTIPAHFLRAFAAVVSQHNVAKGLFVHTGTLSTGTQELVQQLGHIEVIEGCDLRALVLQTC